MRFRSFVPWILVAAPIAIPAFGCYGATQVTVALSTDLACDGTVDTLLYKGAPQSLDSTPNAETRSCTNATAVGADSDIGTITVTPSGEKNAQVEVKAVLARNNKDPAKCDADPTDCIVATRTFSFAEHSSQRVSIRLLQDCIGTVCPTGQTCVGPGQCSSNTTTCNDPDGCQDAGTVDGGADAGFPVSSCKARTLATLSATIPPDQQTTFVRAARSMIYWYDGTQARGVYVDDKSAAPPIATAAPIALADGGGELALLTGTEGKWTYKRGGMSVDGTTGAPLSVAGTASFGIVGTTTGSYLVGGAVAGKPGLSSSRSDRVLVVGGQAFVSNPSEGIHVFQLTGGAFAVEMMGAGYPLGLFPSSGTPVAFALNPGAAHGFVAGTPKSADLEVLADLADIPPITRAETTGSKSAITSLAVDDTYAYWTHKDDGVTFGNATKGTTRLVADTGKAISVLATENGCLYFWQATDGNNALLRSVPTPL